MYYYIEIFFFANSKVVYQNKVGLFSYSFQGISPIPWSITLYSLTRHSAYSRYSINAID